MNTKKVLLTTTDLEKIAGGMEMPPVDDPFLNRCDKLEIRVKNALVSKNIALIFKIRDEILLLDRNAIERVRSEQYSLPEYKQVRKRLINLMKKLYGIKV